MPATTHTPSRSRHPERVVVAAVSTGKYGALRGRAGGRDGTLARSPSPASIQGSSSNILRVAAAVAAASEALLPKDDGWSCGLAGGNHEGKGHAFQGGAKEALMRYASCEETILLLLWVLAYNAPCLGVRAWWQHLYPAAEALRTLLTKGGGAGVLYVHAVLSCCGI